VESRRVVFVKRRFAERRCSVRSPSSHLERQVVGVQRPSAAVTVKHKAAAVAAKQTVTVVAAANHKVAGSTIVVAAVNIVAPAAVNNAAVAFSMHFVALSTE